MFEGFSSKEFNTYEILLSALTEDGQRETDNKRTLCETLVILCRNGGHPLAEEIVNDAFGVKANNGTTYRLLQILREKGLVEMIEIGDGRRRYEIKKEPHGHVIDRLTGDITEFEFSDEMRKEMTSHALQRGLTPSDFTVLIHCGNLPDVEE